MPVSSAIDVVLATVPAGSRVIDIGCGDGNFATALTAAGYRVTGVDPQDSRIAKARISAPDIDFRVAGAEALPFPDQSFDAATMVHSLHHVPPNLMRSALEEALRCIGTGAPLIVVEPPPEGSFHEVFKLIDDETEIRNRAQDSLEDACREGALRRDGSWRWDTTEIYADADAMIEDVATVDIGRRERATALKQEIEAALRTYGKRGPQGYALIHPIRADLFRRG